MIDHRNQNLNMNRKLVAFLGGMGSVLALYPSPERAVQRIRAQAPVYGYWQRVGTYLTEAMDEQDTEVKTAARRVRQSHNG